MLCFHIAPICLFTVSSTDLYFGIFRFGIFLKERQRTNHFNWIFHFISSPMVLPTQNLYDIEISRKIASQYSLFFFFCRINGWISELRKYLEL